VSAAAIIGQGTLYRENGVHSSFDEAGRSEDVTVATFPPTCYQLKPISKRSDMANKPSGYRKFQ
jgi:hypothetical protein